MPALVAAAAGAAVSYGVEYYFGEAIGSVIATRIVGSFSGSSVGPCARETGRLAELSDDTHAREAKSRP